MRWATIGGDDGGDQTIPAANDIVAGLVNDIRSAVSAATSRRHVTVLHIKRGNVDLDRPIGEWKRPDVQVRRITDLVAGVAAATPPLGGKMPATDA